MANIFQNRVDKYKRLHPEFNFRYEFEDRMIFYVMYQEHDIAIPVHDIGHLNTEIEETIKSLK